MIYTGQAFPNLAIEDSEVTLKVSGKPKFENDYFLTYDQMMDMWISFRKDRHRVPNSVTYSRIYLPRQHYSWTSFIETLKKLYLQEFNNNGYINLSETQFAFTEKNITLDVIFTVDMSDDFRNTFGIATKLKPIHDFNNRWVHNYLPITNIPKPVADSSLVFYTPFAIETHVKFTVDDETVFQLTLQYWTVNMFKRAINAIGKSFTKDSWLSAMSIEDGNSEEDCTLVLTANSSKMGDKQSMVVTVSQGFNCIFQTNATIFTLQFTEPLRIPLSIVSAEEQGRKWSNFEASGRLQNNYYPDIGSLIKELNHVLSILKLDIAKQRGSSTNEFTFFNIAADVVTFNGKDGFTVLLSTGLLKMMHLPSSWLTKTITGSEAVVMKTYKRSHLYIHLDCLDYHYINNNVSDLIKIVPNSVALDEKVLVTFSDPHYYAVSRRYMSTINIYITDSYFNGILQFDRDIAYTLHFRKCLHSL